MNSGVDRISGCSIPLVARGSLFARGDPKRLKLAKIAGAGSFSRIDFDQEIELEPVWATLSHLSIKWEVVPGNRPWP